SNAAGSSRFIDLVTTILTMGPGVKSGRLWRQSMNAPAQAAKVSAHLAALSLKDPKLFREQCYIGGEWVGGANTIPVRNPATESVRGTVPRLGAEEARRAVDAADRAWPAWRAKTGRERAAILRKWFELMIVNQEELAQILTAEPCKTLAQ